jgi:hypothetical protein
LPEVDAAVIGQDQKDACHRAASAGNMRSVRGDALKE